MMHYEKLSESERLVMDVAWELGEVSNPIIVEQLKGIRDWNRHTVKAYTKRLTEKGFLEEKQINARQYYYYPLVNKDDYLAGETHEYMSRNFDGISAMVAGLINREHVPLDELKRLEQVIKDYKDNLDE